MKILSVVCARSGSVGLKNKCVERINGKMVVEYSIEYSLSLGKDIKTVVSTDIEELIAYCVKKNITYIRRNPKLCLNDSRIENALADAIEKEGEGYIYGSLLYGNIPIRFPKMFHEAVNYLKEHKDYDAVISMQNVEKFHPEWMLDYSDEILPRQIETQHSRQALSQKMISDGHTLVFNAEKFYKRFKGINPYNQGYMYSMYGDKIKPLITKELIIDIDTKKDFELAKAIIENRSLRRCD